MPQIITEAVSLSAAPLAKSGRIRIKIIDAGTGSSGIYPAATLEAAGKDKVFGKGLHMYADHPGATETYDRPERTIKDLAAVLETDAVYENGGLYAEAKVFPHWREVIAEMADDIGVSIRASAEVEDTAAGRTITRLVAAESVDFVTKAGRGGKVMEVLESARITERAIVAGVTEATANDTREWLQAAIKDANSADNTYAWLRDYDATTVWYELDTNGSSGTYQQGYTLTDTTVTLDGSPIEVRVQTTYTPITAPAAESVAGRLRAATNTFTNELREASKNSPPNPAGSTEEKEGATMATTIEESRLTQLEEASGRVPVLEAEITTATARATTAEAALTESNDTAAAAIVNEALTEAGLTAPKTAARLAKGYPVKENGALDTVALTADVAESIAELAEANGAGTVRGVGSTVESAAQTRSAEDIVSVLEGGK